MNSSMGRRRRRAVAADLTTLSGIVAAGLATTFDPSTATGWQRFTTNGADRCPAATNLVPCPAGIDTGNVYWPASTAHTTVTKGVDLPVPLPAELDGSGVTKCVRFSNDGTADAPETATVAVGASKSHFSGVYVYAPTLGGTLTITAEDGHSFTIGAVAAANGTFVPLSIKSPTVAGETTMKLRFSFAGGTASVVYVTAASIVEEAGKSPFFCGATTAGGASACAWTGTANASSSTRAVTDLRWTVGAPDAGGTLAFRVMLGYAYSAGVASDFYCALGGSGNFLTSFASGVPSKFDIYGGTLSSANAGGSAWTANSFHRMVCRWSASKQDVCWDGSNGTQANRTGTNTPGTTFMLGNGLGAAYVKAYDAFGYVLIPASRKPDTLVAAWDAHMAAGPNAATLLRDYCDAGDVLIPLTANSKAYLKTGGAGVPWEEGVMIFEGDSQTAGGGSLYNWPTQMQNAIAPHLFRVYNVATSGNTINQIQTQFATEVTPHLNEVVGKQILCVFAGTNDLMSNDDAATAYGELATYCTAAKAAGWKVIIATLPSLDATGNSKRAAFNQSIRDNIATIGTSVADLAADARLGDDGAVAAAIYFNSPTDIHLNASGLGIVAGIFKTQVLALL